MKHPLKLLIIPAVLLFCFPAVKSQESIGVSGSSASGTNGSASYSVGQFVYSTLSGITGTVVQGVQQPYEISVVTAVENSSLSNLEYIVYPNPATGYLKFNTGSDSYEDLKIKLIDFKGVVLLEKKIDSPETMITLDEYASSVYFLKVYRNNLEVKVFRIIKN